MTKVLVRGPVLTRSGYGEHVRFILRALREIEDRLDLYVIPLGWGQTGWVIDNDDERTWLDSIIKKTTIAVNNNNLTPDVSIQVTIPNEWEKIAPVNIGVTAGIETTKVAPIWLEKSNLMDLIIVPSQHAKDTLVNTTYEVTMQQTGQVIPDYRCVTPVEVVSYPVKNFDDMDINLDLETDFNFLAIAQWGPRKNMVNCVEWFVEEFIDKEVGLVIKTNLAKNSILDRNHTLGGLKNILNQEKYKDRKCKVYLLHGDMTDQEIHQLYRNPKIKALVSTTHGEGFGLPLFEAAYEGLPVIAPWWSGHVDFLNMPVIDKKGKVKKKSMFAKVDYVLAPVQDQAVWDGVVQRDSKWAYADQGSFKIRMREVFKDHGRFKKQATQLKKYLNENLTSKNQNEKICSLISEFEVYQEWLDTLKEIEIL